MGLNLFKSNLTKEEIKKEIFISVVISYITIFANVLISLFYTPFLLRTIGTSQYGIHSFALSVVSWLSIVTTALCSGYLKFATAEAKKDPNSVKALNGIYFWFFILIDLLVIIAGLVLTALFWTGVIPLSDYTDSERVLVAPCVLLMVVNSFISIFVSYFSLFEAYKERFVWARLISLLQKVLNPAISIPFLLLGGNVVVICAIQAGLTFLNLVLLAFHAFKVSKMKISLKIGYGQNKKLIISIVTFSLFALLSTAATSLNQSADQIILGIATNPTSVAIYQLGMSFVSYLSLFCSSITNSLTTKLYNSDLDDKEKTNKLFLKISQYQMILAFLIVGGFLTCGKEFMILWAGKENSLAFYIGAMLFVANLFSFTSTSSEVIVKSRGYFKFEAIYYLVEALTNIGVSILFIYLFGSENAIIACCSATVVVMLLFRWVGLTIFYGKKIKLPMSSYYYDLAKFLVISLFCFTLSYGIKRVINLSSNLANLLILGSIFTISYCVITYFLQKGIVNELFKMFKRKK